MTHVLEKYSAITLNLLVWKSQFRHTNKDFFGVEDSLIQPYSGHESRKTSEIYSKLSIRGAQGEYDNNKK